MDTYEDLSFYHGVNAAQDQQQQEAADERQDLHFADDEIIEISDGENFIKSSRRFSYTRS